MIPTELVCHEGATLEIGADSLFNYGVAIEALHSVSIGQRCMMASFVVIRDATRHARAPIVVEDDVWIAHGAVIEPGVTIGRGSVVSARSVVVNDVPPESLAIGSPARAMSLGLMAPSG